MGLYLSVGAECQDTRTEEPSLDGSTLTQCGHLGTPICNVIGIDGSVTSSTFDAGGDASAANSRRAASHRTLQCSGLLVVPAKDTKVFDRKSVAN